MLETSLFVATLATLGMLSPGPDFFLIVRNAARYQRSAAMMTSLGVILGVATHMAYCVAGLAVLITTTPWLFNALKYTGAVYLIWIGIQALRSRGGAPRPGQGPGGGGQAARRPADRPRGQGRPELKQAGGATPRCGAASCLRARR